MNYERGFKRIYLVMAICWVAFCAFAVLAVSSNHDAERQMAAFSLAGIAVPIIGYFFFFRLIPWIMKGFK